MNKSNRRCPNCTDAEMMRIQRRGFLQERVYSRLGLYPWECPFCREVFLLKRRGRSYRRSAPGSKGNK